MKKRDCDKWCQQYIIWTFLMEKELYLIKLENRRRETRIPWDYLRSYNVPYRLKIRRLKLTKFLKNFVTFNWRN